LVQLIHHVLSQNNASDFTLLVSLMMRGDGDSLEQNNTATTTTPQAANDWEDLDDESDDDEEEEEEDIAKPDSKEARSSSRYTRKDLLTLVKLDKLYQDRIQQLKRDCTTTYILRPRNLPTRL
jgi:hypothetical protein